MGKRQSSRQQSGTQLRRVNRRALRLAVFVFLLPVPAALAAPQAATLPKETLVAMSQVPVRGVGDTVLPRVLPLDSKGSGPVEPAASLTRLEKAQRDQAAASEIAANGIPAAALRAYRTAEATMSVADPGCRLSWELLAGIGRIESDHGRYAGAVLGTDGISTPAIVGLPLNGVGPVAAIADTDNGTLDGDTRWDRAVGPMQFIPSTWAMVGVDGDADGKRDPHDIDDAALAAAAYLCVGEYDLSTPVGVQQAVFSYNHSADYVALVLGVAHAYASGEVDLPLLTATLQLPTGPGASVDLSQGRGVPIGVSDDVSDQAKDEPAAKRNRADRADDRAQDRTGNGPDRTDDSVDRRGGGSNEPAGDDRTSDGRSPGGSGGDGSTGGGGDRRGDGTDSKDGTDGSDSNDGADGSDGDADKPDVKPSPTPTPTPTPTPEPEPEPEPIEPIWDDSKNGTLVYCDADEDTLCLEGSEDEPIEVDSVADYAHLLGSPVTVVYQSDDNGETWYLYDIVEEGTFEEPQD